MAQRITTVPDAIEAVYNTMNKYAMYGAYDTEPRAEFAEVLVRLVNGQDPRVPQKANSSRFGESNWQLYSTMKGSFFAGKALTRATERVVKLAQASQEGMDGVVGFVREQGWLW